MLIGLVSSMPIELAVSGVLPLMALLVIGLIGLLWALFSH